MKTSQAKLPANIWFKSVAAKDAMKLKEGKSKHDGLETATEDPMTVERLTEELQKLPPQAQLVEVVVRGQYTKREVLDVRWQGNLVSLEVE